MLHFFFSCEVMMDCGHIIFWYFLISRCMFKSIDAETAATEPNAQAKYYHWHVFLSWGVWEALLFKQRQVFCSQDWRGYSIQLRVRLVFIKYQLNLIIAKLFFLKDLKNVFFISRCAEGYMGQRCEFKDLDGSYLRKCLFLNFKIWPHFLFSSCIFI